MKIPIQALLLLLTITRFPGGIAEQLKPLTSWLAGKPNPHARHHRHGDIEESTDDETAREPAAAGKS